MIEMNVFLMLQSFGLGSSQAALVALSLNELFRINVRSVALFTLEHLKVGSCGGGWVAPDIILASPCPSPFQVPVVSGLTIKPHSFPFKVIWF